MPMYLTIIISGLLVASYSLGRRRSNNEALVGGALGIGLVLVGWMLMQS